MEQREGVETSSSLSGEISCDTSDWVAGCLCERFLNLSSREAHLSVCQEWKDTCLIKKTKQNGTPLRETSFQRVNYKGS